MTTFIIMTKHNSKERFRRCFATTNAKRAELVAKNESNEPYIRSVKVIATDDNGITNEIIYK